MISSKILKSPELNSYNLIEVDAISLLLIEAASEFYQKIPCFHKFNFTNSINKQLLKKDTEFENIFLLQNTSETIGAISYLDLLNLEKARTTFLYATLAELPSEIKIEFMNSLKVFSKKIEPHYGKGLYMSRITINKSFRSQGFGLLMMKMFIEKLGAKNPLSLHVHKTNLAAINLYIKMGFKPSKDLDSMEMLFMARDFD